MRRVINRNGHIRIIYAPNEWKMESAPVTDAALRLRRSPAAILDRRSARHPHQSAGPDERMAPPGAELRNVSG